MACSVRICSPALIPFPGAGLVPLASPAAGIDGPFRFKVSPDSDCFTGHFEGLPVLPAVAHLAMVMTACARRQGRAVTLIAAREVRFKRPLRPGEEVEIVLADGGEPSSVRFEMRCNRELASRGLLVVEPSFDDVRS